MFKLELRPYVTIADLKRLTALPGHLGIYIAYMKNMYVPFVMHDDPLGQRTSHGPILTDGHLVAAANLDDLKEALYESLGKHILIHEAFDQVQQPKTFH